MSSGGSYQWGITLYERGAVLEVALAASALTHIANFTGSGTHAILDSSLSAIFGVSVSGSSFTALCGSAAVSLGSLPAAMFVELRPLNGLGDIIIRDEYGSMPARHGCQYAATPRYVGFRGGLLKVYNITAMG
jgi:hypothetical protein